MKKLLLLSVIIATIVIPARAARMKNPRQGLKKALLQMVVFDLVYVFLVLFVWHRL
jgi:hypothetical protein